MTCVCTVTYLVVINGSPSGHIVPTRGLRQGVPLSPCLFLLCIEGFSAMIRKAKEQGIICGVLVTRLASRVSHLLLADHSVIFMGAFVQQCNILKNILKEYERVSRQLVNIEKYAVLFNSNTTS